MSIPAQIAANHKLVSLDDGSGEHPYLVALRKVLGQIGLARRGITDADYTVEEGEGLARRARVRIVLYDCSVETEGADVNRRIVVTTWDHRSRPTQVQESPKGGQKDQREADKDRVEQKKGRTLHICFDGARLWLMEQRPLAFIDLVGDVKKIILQRYCTPFDNRMLMWTNRAYAQMITNLGTQWGPTYPVRFLTNPLIDGPMTVWPPTEDMSSERRHLFSRWVLPYQVQRAVLAWEYLVFLFSRGELRVTALCAPPSPIRHIVHLTVVVCLPTRDAVPERAVLSTLRTLLPYAPYGNAKLKRGGSTEEYPWEA